MIIIKEYLTESGQSPFRRWRRKLDATLQYKVAVALAKLELARALEVKDLRQGLFEMRIHSGGGLRIYFAEDGDDIILLLGGGQKDSQTRDIENARNRLVDYLARKERENGR